MAGAEFADERLRALDRFWWDLVGEAREIGGALDRDPLAVDRFLDSPALRFARYQGMPAAYRDGADVPGDLLDTAASCQGSLVVLERAAYGDPNVVLAAPGPGLSGTVVRAIADEAQADRYYRRLAAAPVHTFFALTEPDKGSAAGELSTTLTEDGDGWLLNGEKRYIGNGAFADCGVVFCRRAPGPWGIEAVLVDSAAPGFTAEALPMLGLRGIRISRLRFDNVRIPRENLLGAHLRPSRRGLRGALTGLYRFRPGIAAMALGCAAAAGDYLHECRPLLPKAAQFQVDDLADRLAAVRRLTYQVAADIDHGVVDTHRIGAVKAASARVGEEMTMLVARLLGPASLVEHTWLEKLCRDVRAFEIMEGTANLHRLSIFQGLLKGTYLTTWDGAADAARD
jgi:alkylation response protein AidB-like acyl-CoA dehydrogenase